MSESRAVDTVSGLDYEEIEQAVMETARGRWFLNEFARRQRASDTKILLDAIRRLEDQLLAMPAASSNPAPKAAPEQSAPQKQLAAVPAAEPAAESAPRPVAAEQKPVQPAAPKFVPSDDDLFEAAPAPVAASAPATPVRPARAISADTLDFSSIEVPPLPDRVTDSDESDDGVEEAAAGPAATASGAPPPASREDELKARDRVIQVTRSGSPNNRRLSDFGPPPELSMNGRINVSAPAAANQPSAETTTPASHASTGRPATDANAQKKRIIVIRRPAEGTDGIPLAGE